MRPTTAQFHKLLAEQERSIEAFAERVRRELIIPACCKHGLTFMSGMGTWCFARGKETLGEGYTPNFDGLMKRYGLTVIIKLLEETLPGGRHELGMYVGDVTEHDLPVKQVRRRRR